MSWLTALHILPHFIAAAITAAVGVYAWQRRNVPGAAPLAGLLLLVTLWQVGSGLSVTCNHPQAAYFWHRVAFSAIALIATAALIFILQFSGRGALLSPARLTGLLVFPVATLLIIWSNDLHHGFIQRYTFVWNDGFMLLTDWQGGVWFRLHSVYNFLLTLLAIAIIAWSALRSPQPFRGQMATILAWGGLSLLFTIPLTLIPYRSLTLLSALLPTLNSLGFAWAVFRFRLFDLSPVARDLLIETMNDGMVALDLHGRVVDANRALEQMTGLPRTALIGSPLARLPAPWNTLEQITELLLGQGRQVHVQHLPLTDTQQRQRGQLIILRDITALKLMETLELRVAARTRDLSTLYRVASLIGRSLDVTEALRGCLQALLEATGSAAGWLLLQEDTGNWKMTAAQGNCPPPGLQGEALSGWREVALGNEPLLVHSLADSPWAARLFPGGCPFPALAAAPLPAGAQTGVLAIFGAQTAQFNIEALGLLTTIAEQVAIAIENDRLRHQQQASAVLIERQRLARDLHDSVTQLLYSQLLFARAAQKSLSTGEPGRAAEFLGRLDSAAQQALREMRLLIYQLRPADLDEIGLVEALRRRLELVEQRAGLTAQLHAETLNLPAEAQLGLYHIAEEALNNALKHAAPSRVTVTLRQSDSGLALEIDDNGCGFDPAHVHAGLGLTGMRERAALLAADLKITSAPGSGTHLRLWLPTPPEETPA